MNHNYAISEAAWPPQKIAEMTRFYVDEGLTDQETAQRMGLTKNQVIGKRTRLGLVRGGGFVPTVQQAGQLRAQKLRGPSTTLFSRMDALHAAFDAARVPDPPRLKPVKKTDNPTRPTQRGAR